MKFFLISLSLFISVHSMAADSLEVSGKKYDIVLKEVPCVNGAEDLFFPAARVTHSEMYRAGCNIKAKFDSSIDCAKIDEKILIRDFLNSNLRNKNYCSCSVGPSECATVCSKYLSNDECAGLCAGSCALAYPQK